MPVPKFRFRFGLRSVLAAMLLCGLAFGYVHRARDQQAAIAQLRAANPGAVLWYNDQLDAAGKRREATSPRAAWLRERLGDDYLSSVAAVELYYPTDADLTVLARFGKLRHLVLERSIDLTDESLATIGQLVSLESLVLGEAAQVTGAGLQQLARLKHLKSLQIDPTPRVTRDDFDQLRASLPHCQIVVRAPDQWAAVTTSAQTARRSADRRCRL